MESLVPVVLVVAGGYAALTSLVYLIQEKILFQPSRGSYGTPSQIRLDYEDLRLPTEDGETLHGWWVPAQDARGTILFFHGNAGNVTTRLETIKTLHDLRLNVFIFDYRGYGESTGEPTERGLYKDAEAAWHHLISARKIPPGKIILHGRSLGAGVATWLAERMPEGAIILESAFTSVPDIGSHHYPYLPVRLLTRVDFDSLARIGNCRSPVLVIHSRDDEIVPFAHGERLFKAARDPKRFAELTGSHEEGFVVSHDAYVRAIDDFVTTFVEGDRIPRESGPN